MAPRKGEQFSAEAQMLKSMSTLAQRDFMKSHLSSLMPSQQASRASSAASSVKLSRAPKPPAAAEAAKAQKKPAEGISMTDLHKAVNALANAPALLLPRKRPLAKATPNESLAVSATPRSSVSKCSSAASALQPPPKTRRLEDRRADGSALFKGLTSIPLGNAVAQADGDLCASRHTASPLWSLIGTYKVAMTSVVDVDLAERVLKWHQRNPKGGFIGMRVSLQLITDVSLAKVSLEDQQVAETTFSVVIKTASGKPSQVVFGFASLKEATRLKALLKASSK